MEWALHLVGAGLGLAAFAAFWDGQMPLFAQEGGIGVEGFQIRSAAFQADQSGP